MTRVKNRIRKNNARTVKKSFPRFLSLTVMSFLGMFAFVGLASTAPDMIETLDCYLDVHSVYDIKLVSDMGFDAEDVNTVAAAEGIAEACGSKSIDVIIQGGERESVMNIASLPESLNTIDVKEGRLPEKANEIAVEENFLTLEGFSIGDTIEADHENIKEKTLTITGSVDSALYYNNTGLDSTRGYTSIGSGKINYYAYMPAENYDTDIYTAIYACVEGAERHITSDGAYTECVDAAADTLSGMKASLAAARRSTVYKEAEDKIKEAEDEAYGELADADKELRDAKTVLDDAKKQLDETAAMLALMNPDMPGYAEMQAAYDAGLAQYDETLGKYEDSLAEYEKALADADREFADARRGLDDIPTPNIYVYDRTEYSTYADYIDDSNSVRNLATLFPAVFFAVAVLVSLVSMNRMVDDDRLEIGTMKSLGFPDHTIMSKYLSFSLWATVVGSLLGAASGMIVIPALIFHIYSILFTLPGLHYGVQPLYITLGFLITVICVCGSSVWTAYKALRLKPAELMRPKAPASGHRIFLERFSSLWGKLTFSRKVTLRNLFRYKKRVLVTIGGIAGCTALMLTGFGVKDAIVDVPSAQYYDIYQFDGTSFVGGISEDGEDGKVSLSHFAETEGVTHAAAVQRTTADMNGINGYMLVLRPEDLQYAAKFVSIYDGKPLQIEPGKAIINEKLSALTGLKCGDRVNIVDVNNRTYDIEISGITENYIEHFVYTDISAFEAAGGEFSPNLVYFNTDAETDDEKARLSEELLKEDGVLSIAYRSDLIDSVDNSLKSLDSVVLILIVLAALLAFVVLYNLSNINITERRREIATLKVLGFYDDEVDGYISKEMFILSIIGIALGLVLGIFLCHAVVSTVEVEKCRFMNVIKPMSFVYSAGMSAAFSLIVSVITHFRLKRIDMIDSLKSVE